LSTNSENYDEEALLKIMHLAKLTVKISKLTFSWNDHSDAAKQAGELMNEIGELSLEITEFNQRMGSNLNKYQQNQIKTGMEQLEKILPYMESKIKPIESLEIVDQTDNSLV